MPDVACSVCGRRDAFYYRNSSGEKLCARCLEDSLSNRIKHSFSGRARLGRNPVVSVYIPPSKASEGVVLVYLLSKIEAKFNGRVEVIASCDVLNNVRGVFDNLLKTGDNINYHELRGSSVGSECSTSELIASTVMLLGNLWNSGALRGTQAVLLPYTLTDLNEALMEHIILGSGKRVPPDFSECSIEGTPMICPFCTIQRTDVMALAYVYGILKLINAPFITNNAEVCKTYNLVRRLVSEISLKHPELAHTMLKSRRFFLLQPTPSTSKEADPF